MNEYTIHDHQFLRDLHIDPQGCVELADASDRIEQEQAKRIMQYGAQIISLREQNKRLQDENEEYNLEMKVATWMVIVVLAYGLAMTILWWNKP